MADQEQTADLNQGGAEASDAEGAGKKGSPKLLIIVLLAIVLAGGGFFGFKVMSAGKSEEKELKVGEIVTLEEFLVNLADGTTFLRINLALGIAEGMKVGDGVGKDDKHGGGADTPQVRDAIIMILTSKKPQDINTIAGKEELKAEIIRRLNEILGDHKPKETGKSTDNHTDSPEKGDQEIAEEKNAGPVLEVYFTSFATQKY